MMQIVLAQPRGFCAGVERAVSMVERALQVYGAPVYVRHEIVHNRQVVDQLRDRGAVFVDEVARIPKGAHTVFSAHGVSPAVSKQARVRGLRTLDATCPLVTKVHLEVARHARAGRSVVLVGHRGHAEIEGTLGHFQAVGDAQIHLIATVAEAEALCVHRPEHLAYATQTTLSVDDTARILSVLKRRFPAIQGPQQADICYATQNRQNAVRMLATRAQVVLVVGAWNSSNSQRLAELARQCGRPAYLVESAEVLDPGWFAGDEVVGLTSGASVPEPLVLGVISRLQEWWPGATVEAVGEPEHVLFPLPRELRHAAPLATSASAVSAAAAVGTVGLP